MLIGLIGKIGSGKTTVSEMLIKKGYTEYSMAKPLKDIAKIFGFTEKQIYGSQQDKLEIHPYWKVSARYFLQKLGTEGFRQTIPTIMPDINISDGMLTDIVSLQIQNNIGKNIVVSDVRFENEAKMIRRNNGILIRILRDHETSDCYSQHASETEMDNIQVDYTIDNDYTLDDLFLSLENILSHYDQ